jgi:hypothetical protein
MKIQQQYRRAYNMPRKKAVSEIVETKSEQSTYKTIDAQRLNDEFWNTDKAIPVKISNELTIKMNPFPSI